MTHKDKDLPKRGMSHEELVEKHKFLDEELSAERSRRVPNDVKIRRLKRLKTMYKVRIDGLQPKSFAETHDVSTAEILDFPAVGDMCSFAPATHSAPLQQRVAVRG